MFSMLGVFAEFERAIIKERIHAGLKRARAADKTLGRPRVRWSLKQGSPPASQGCWDERDCKTVGCGVRAVQRIVAQDALWHVTAAPPSKRPV